MRSRAKSGLAAAGLLLAALIWGFAFVIVKNTVDLVPPFYMMALRFTLAGALMALIFMKKMIRLSLADLKAGWVLGLFLFASYALQTVGIKYTTAGKNAFLTTIYVVLAPFLHWLLERVRPGRKVAAAAGLALAGIGLLSLNGDLSVNLGDGLTIGCGLTFAVHLVLVARYAKRHDPLVMTVLQLGVAALLSWAVAPFAEGGFPVAAFEPEALGGLIYLGVLSTSVAFALQNIGQKYVEPSVAAILLSCESLFGVLSSTLFLRERMTGRMIAGCALLFLAILLVEAKLPFGREKPAARGEGEA
ncbi:MAG: DMT family transporter [Christensenellaceae bacterium]|jgi:drug/metabolite transporter (DMT)-like permease|nr:DMT family transporter [Christensenellaceae bacterium]